MTRPNGSSLSNDVFRSARNRPDLIRRQSHAFDSARRLDENADVLRRGNVLLKSQRHVQHVVLALAEDVSCLPNVRSP